MNNGIVKDIIMTGYTALCTTSYLARQYYKDLCDTIPEGILCRSQRFSFGEQTDADNDVKKALGIEAIAIYPVGYGGVFKALWEMADKEGIGIRIYQKNIPIKQETIEICNVLDVNPYLLDGKGSCLILSVEGNRLIRKLAEAGITATIIGHTTSDNDRVVVSGEETRYLTHRVTDELERLEEK